MEKNQGNTSAILLSQTDLFSPAKNEDLSKQAKKKSEGKSLIFSFRHRITNTGVVLRTRGEKNGRKFSRFTLHFHLTEGGGWPQKSNIGQFGLDKLWDIFACARNSGPE